MTTTLTNEQREAAILLDVVAQFEGLKLSISRRDLLIKYRNQPTWEAINNLVNQNIIRRKNSNQSTADEEYLPTAAGFHFCGDGNLRDRAKFATTIVLKALQQMFVREQKADGFVFEDLKRYVALIHTDQLHDDATLKLGLYLAKDFHVLAGNRLTLPDETEVEWFQIGEGAIAMVDPEAEWDRVMAGVKWPIARRAANLHEAAVHTEGEARWERIRPLGGGGQSDVFLVRSPARVSQRESHLKTIRTASDGDKRAELAEAIWSYARPDSPAELAAMKIFKIRDEGSEQQAIARLKQEMQVLRQKRPGLPELLDANESERWMVTEFFPRGTVEDNISKYQGKPALALKAFLSLVNTVALLHNEDIVHRDIKPANVFVGNDDELVLGDFGIVFMPNQPARLTRTNESVGPHDYMPPWGEEEGRIEEVHTNFDVYMLGKLLWCMVSGRLLLKREWFRHPQNDISSLFKHDPHAYMINIILEKCVVENPKNCISIHDLRGMVIAFLNVIEQGGQLLLDKVPRPCHVCGIGGYQPEALGQSYSTFNMRLWNTRGGSSDINLAAVRLYVCTSCGHIAFFRDSVR